MKVHHFVVALLFVVSSAFAREGRVQHLADGADAWWARYQLIKSAKKSIHVQYFSLFNDVMGESLMALLIDKAREHVKVRVMVDGRGTTPYTREKHLQELVANGIEVKVYNPMLRAGISLLRSIVSNHDKILLVDNRYFVTGGRNIAVKYFVRTDEWNDRVFHDTDSLVELEEGDDSVLDAFMIEWNNPVARSVPKKLFGNLRSREPEMRRALRALEDRMFHDEVSAETRRNHPEVERFKSLRAAAGFKLFPSDAKYPYRVLDKTSRFGKKTELRDEILKAVGDAESEVVIQNPYLVLTRQMEAQLLSVDRKGVAIRVSVTSPTSTDSLLTQSILATEWQRVLRELPHAEIHAGIGPDQLHAKIVVIDRKKAIVGSYNMDSMSQDHNGEIALEVDSPEFASQVLAPIDAYIDAKSVQYRIDPAIGPEQIENSRKAIDKVENLYWLASILRPLI